MASEADRQELQRKVKKLVDGNFKGDYRKAFDHYDQGITKNGKINKAELIKLLEDADLGNFITRGEWANEIIKELDKDKDNSISWTEFEEKIRKAK